MSSSPKAGVSMSGMLRDRPCHSPKRGITYTRNTRTKPCHPVQKPVSRTTGILEKKTLIPSPKTVIKYKPETREKIPDTHSKNRYHILQAILFVLFNLSCRISNLHPPCSIGDKIPLSECAGCYQLWSYMPGPLQGLRPYNESSTESPRA